jgi:ATP-dependent RNA helicase RhlE
LAEGTVKWFDNEKGFGFIEWDESEDIFVHYSEIDGEGYKTLEEGNRVTFDTKETEKGLAATDVRTVNGQSDSNGTASTEESQTFDEDDGSDETVEETVETPVVEESFEDLGLNQELLDNLEHAGFETPRPIQVKSIPPILENRDLIGTAPTGTGKTAAFLLPILQRLSEGESTTPRALVLAPTHELAEQIAEEARMLSTDLGVSVDSVYGGTDIWDEMERLRNEEVDLLVACPGRLRDHLGRGTADLDELEVVVLDEADRMCDMGFLPEIKKILKYAPRDRQNLFFSATIPPEIEELAEDMMEDPAKFSVGSQKPAETISHYVCQVGQNEKYKALKSILENTQRESVLVFCRTRNTVREVAQKLRQEGYDASPLQGGMEPVARDATLSGFRKQSFDILVSTNVAARGLDVEHISHVINYDVPEDPDVYTHRLGRTGRSGSEGEAYTLVTPGDQSEVDRIQSTIEQTIDRRPVPTTS